MDCRHNKYDHFLRDDEHHRHQGKVALNTSELKLLRQLFSKEITVVSELCERIKGCMLDSSDKDSYHDALNTLSTFLRKHFDDEESAMRQIGYPELDAHKMDHDHLIERMVDVMFGASCGSANIATSYDFIVAWKEQHVETADALCVKFIDDLINKQGCGA